MVDGNDPADERRQLMAPATLQDLDHAIEVLRRATLMDKAAAAERAFTIARAVLGRFEARLAALERRS